MDPRRESRTSRRRLSQRTRRSLAVLRREGNSGATASVVLNLRRPFTSDRTTFDDAVGIAQDTTGQTNTRWSDSGGV
jgi:hypothetical protein